MNRFFYLVGCIASVLLCALSLAIIPLLSGRDATLGKFSCAVLALFAAHASFRGYLLWRESRRERLVEGQRGPGRILLPPATVPQTMRAYFDPADMKVGTSFAILFQTWLLLAGYFLHNQQAMTLFVVATAFMLILHAARAIGVWRVARLAAKARRHTLLYSYGIGWMFPVLEDEPVTDEDNLRMGLAVEWKELKYVSWHRHYARVVTNTSPSQIYLFFDAKHTKEDCKALIWRYLHYDNDPEEKAAAKQMEDEMMVSLGRFAQPSIAFLPETAAPADVEVGASKIGGLPHLPADVAWPEHDGHPLSLLMQVNCADVAAHDRSGRFPATGFLWVFCEMEDDRYSITDNDDMSCNPATYRVIYRDVTAAALRLTEKPEALDCQWMVDERLITFSYQDTIPSFDQMTSYDTRVIDDPDRYFNAAERLGCPADDGSDTEAGHFLGWSDDIQNSPLRPDVKDDMLLLQLDSLDDFGINLMFGDCGSLYFTITETDLMQRDFSRVRLEMQCY